MKQKIYRPEPVKVSTFFFEHLPDSHDAAAMHVTDSDSANTSPTVRASPAAAAWSLASETGSKAVDAILWDQYTPDAYRQTLKAILDTEAARTHALQEELAKKWDDVEGVLVLNTQRRRALTSSESLLKEAEEKLFWTAQDVVSRFHMDITVNRDASTGPSMGAAPSTLCSSSAASGDAGRATTEYDELAQRARITLDYSVIPTHASGTDSDRRKSEPGMHHAKAWTLKDEELLDYTRRPHHLRRLFAPLLQRRGELPAALTLLLNELQTVQSQQLPRMEAQIESEVMFTVPVYLPLQIIATFITRYLTTVSANEVVEATEVEKARALQRDVDTFQRRLIACAPDDAAVAAMSEDQRTAMAQDMWKHLFNELDAHAQYHNESLHACAEMETRSKQMIQAMRDALQLCATASRHAMASLEADAEQCTTTLTQTGNHTLTVVAAIETSYQKDAEKLKESIQAKARALEKSEALQEKLVRRVRETVKEVYLEQFRYQELAQEWLQERMALQHLTCSYEQVKTAMQTRHEEAVNAREHAANVHALLKEAEELRQGLLNACEQHIGRLETDEFYRRCHVANQAVANVQQWSRAVSDIGHLYEERYAVVANRLTNASWQMEYLMASERDWAVGNLLDVRQELMCVDAKWDAVMSLASQLDLFAQDAFPTLNAMSQMEITTKAREAMRLIDDSKQVQRSVMTLKGYRGRAADTHDTCAADDSDAKTFAAGSGVSAALRLTKTATASVATSQKLGMGATI